MKLIFLLVFSNTINFKRKSYLFPLFANRANALFASAILYTSNFFLNAFHDSFAASINSEARNFAKLVPFFDRAEAMIHFAARKSCRVGFTS